MADVYQTEDEQAEAIKKWLRENGSSLLTGIMLGLAVLFGGKAWLQYQDRQSMAASNLYMQLRGAVAQENEAAASAEHEAIMKDYSGSTYAVLAAMQVARLQLDKDNPVATRAQLQWAYDNAEAGPLKHIARIRYIRVLIGQGELDQAQALLDEVAQLGSFATTYHELQGDLAMAREDYDAARAAYQQALDVYPDDVPGRDLLEAKRNDAIRVTGGGDAS